jgi:hypothetical protein
MNALIDLPDAAVEALPYRLRQTAFATKGKTSIGRPGKEDAFIRSLRTAASLGGVPIYPLNINQTSTGK